MSGTLLFLDSFDHYSATQFLRKWTVGAGAIVPGRTGNGLQISGGGPFKTLPSEYPQITAGMAYNTQNFSNWVWRFFNDLNQLAVEVDHVGDGRFVFQYFASDTHMLGNVVSAPVMNTGEFYYVEMTSTVTAGGSSLTFVSEFRINENPVLNETFTLTTHGTYVSPHVGFASISPGAPGGGFKSTIDDLYVTDTEYLGDIKIAVLYPNAAGDLTQWTPSPAVANFNNVKEHPADDDATTNATDTTGFVDLYNLDDITGFSGTIKGAQALWLTKKSDTGTGAIKGEWKSGGTTKESVEYFPSNVSYTYLIEPERESLFTLADWTVGEINALQLGIKRTR